MEKATALIRYVAVGLLALWVLVRGVGAFAAIVVLFIQSPLSWWVLTPAAIALVLGFAFLLKIRLARKSPNRKFVD